MTILPIYNCFHPVMRKKTEPVTEFDDSLNQLIAGMYDTMYNIPNGIGLAGNQVGESKSIILLDLSISEAYRDAKPITMINPIVEYYSEEKSSDQEGCLSIPALYETFDRPRAVQVKYAGLDEKEYTLEAEDFLARAIQHEIDHLNGKLIIDIISPLRRALIKNKMKKIERGRIDVDYNMIQADGSLYKPK